MKRLQNEIDEVFPRGTSIFDNIKAAEMKFLKAVMSVNVLLYWLCVYSCQCTLTSLPETKRPDWPQLSPMETHDFFPSAPVEKWSQESEHTLYFLFGFLN
jgi:hypothetical protein